MHPTLTQVPPRPHVVPGGDGLTKSKQATLRPSLEASFAQERPPEPPPMTTRSKSYSDSLGAKSLPLARRSSVVSDPPGQKERSNKPHRKRFTNYQYDFRVRKHWERFVDWFASKVHPEFPFPLDRGYPAPQPHSQPFFDGRSSSA